MIGYSRAFNELYGPKPIERKNKMNKRILKIFNEAGFHQPEMERLGIEDKFEKFAELIVKECINEIHVADVGDLKAKGYYLDKVAEHIEKHFGVEE